MSRGSTIGVVRVASPIAAAVCRARVSGLVTRRGASMAASASASAAAWRMPRAVSGGSARPSSSPLRLASVSPELAAGVRQVEVVLPDDPPPADQTHELLDQHHPPRRQEADGAEATEERPEEHVVLGERAGPDEADEDADRDAEQAAAEQA